ncbi:hypothetical protein [Nocardia sp. NPDC057030]|uniref:hypothetical protein n=1 Tax=unclassified Nocardia TaxID=2637762 RepID=UPI003643A72F
MTADPTAVLQRWQNSGALWRVLARRPDRITIGLFDCTGGQEIDRLTSADPALLCFVGDRRSSED